MNIPKRSFISIQIIHVAVLDIIPLDIIRRRHDPSGQVILCIIICPAVMVPTVVDKTLKHWLDLTCVWNQMPEYYDEAYVPVKTFES